MSNTRVTDSQKVKEGGIVCRWGTIPSGDQQICPFLKEFATSSHTAPIVLIAALLNSAYALCMNKTQVEGLRLASRGAPSSVGSAPLTIGLAERGDLLRLLLALRLRLRDADRLPPGLLLRLRLAALFDLHPCMPRGSVRAMHYDCDPHCQATKFVALPNFAM